MKNINVQINRLYHQLSPAFKKRCSEGFLPFLSPKALETIRANQNHCLDRLNALTKATALEGQPISRVIEATYIDCSKTHLYNYASQAWNNDFFLSGLTPFQMEIPPALKAAIQADFGTVDEFQQQWEAHAEHLFGVGWTWLIRNEEGKLQIVCTVLGASPSMHPGIRKRNALSVPSLLGQPVLQRVPLLGLSLWEHAYLPDYGIVGRREYIANYWKAVDWERVAGYLSMLDSSSGLSN